MKKLLLCNVRMNAGAEKAVYKSEDKYIPASDTPVRYPVVAFYEKILKPEDEVKAVLVAKMDSHGQYKENIDLCREELDYVAKTTGAKINVEVIHTPFSEDASTHNDLLLQIIEKIDQNSEITLDMTYGPKDLAIVQFAALNFAERFLGCDIGAIMYGQADFVDGRVTNTRICEMGSLYYLNSIVSQVKCNDPAKATEMLKVLMKM